MMRVTDLGRIGFNQALAVQLAAVQEVRDGGPQRLFLLEHEPVITFGRHGGEEHLLASREFLAAQGVEVIKTSRGGKVTCHFPGQAVAYPVFRLSGRPGGLHRFFFDLEQVVIDVLEQYGLHGERRQGFPGVWCGGGKVASLGIGVKAWVSYHGLALNVGPDLSLFSYINPCGMADVRPASMNLGQADMPGVKRALVQAFARRFFPQD